MFYSFHVWVLKSYSCNHTIHPPPYCLRGLCGLFKETLENTAAQCENSHYEFHCEFPHRGINKGIKAKSYLIWSYLMSHIPPITSTGCLGANKWPIWWYWLEEGLHRGVVVSTVTSEREGSWFKSWLGPFCVEFLCTSRVFSRYSTVQKHTCDDSKLSA